jgi:hypothetical protein
LHACSSSDVVDADDGCADVSLRWWPKLVILICLQGDFEASYEWISVPIQASLWAHIVLNHGLASGVVVLA